MLLRFIGTDGSMGLRHGRTYRLVINPWKAGVRILAPVVCPYETQKSFWRNWERV